MGRQGHASPSRCAPDGLVLKPRGCYCHLMRLAASRVLSEICWQHLTSEEDKKDDEYLPDGSNRV